MPAGKRRCLRRQRCGFDGLVDGGGVEGLAVAGGSVGADVVEAGGCSNCGGLGGCEFCSGEGCGHDAKAAVAEEVAAGRVEGIHLVRDSPWAGSCYHFELPRMPGSSFKFDQADWSEEAGCYGLEVVHVLGVEALAVFGVEGGVVAWGLAGEFIDGGVVDVDFDFVLAGMDQCGDVETIGRVPEGPGAMAVDVEDGGFADGWVEQGADAVGVGRAVVGGGCAVAEINEDATAFGECAVGLVVEDEGAGVGGFAGEVLLRLDVGPRG